MTGLIVGTGSVLTCVHVTLPTLDHARDLRSSIEDVSRLRFSLAHENAHLVLAPSGPNYTGATALAEGIQWIAGIVQVNDWLQLPPGVAATADTAPTFPPDGTLLSPWSHRTSAPAEVTIQAQSSLYGGGSGGLRGRLIALTFREDVLPPDNNAALLRLLDGILAALCLMLVLVLAALGRHLDVRTFALVMLAACLHYGHRGEPADHAFLPSADIRRCWGAARTVM